MKKVISKIDENQYHEYYIDDFGTFTKLFRIYYLGRVSWEVCYGKSKLFVHPPYYGVCKFYNKIDEGFNKLVTAVDLDSHGIQLEFKY